MCERRGSIVWTTLATAVAYLSTSLWLQRLDVHHLSPTKPRLICIREQQEAKLSVQVSLLDLFLLGEQYQHAEIYDSGVLNTLEMCLFQRSAWK